MNFLGSNLGNLGSLLENPVSWLLVAFQIWMLVDALRKGEWFWAVFIFIFPVFNAILYFFLQWLPTRRAGGGATRGFELPGAANRRRIKFLQAQIHHLDKAHHHSQLGDVYFQMGRLDQAEASYRAAFERDPEDQDTLSHFGQCLLRQKRAAEAKGYLEKVLAEDPRHDFGYTLMALAEAQQALGETDAAEANWRRVLQHNSYARARVQLAELLMESGRTSEAREQVQEVVTDDPHAPAFQRSKDKLWVRRARALLAKL